MREGMGLYRGKRKDNGEWVEGHNIIICKANQGNRVFIVPTGEYIDDCKTKTGRLILVLPQVEIDTQTVGEYTGKTDKKNKKIFEGDIVSHFINWLGKRVNGVVRYNSKDASYSCYFDLDNEPKCAFLADWVDGNGAEIIGNVWDNPELLQNT